jgi:hypothetical protein
MISDDDWKACCTVESELCEDDRNRGGCETVFIESEKDAKQV